MPWTQDTALFNCAVLGGTRHSLISLLGPMASFLVVMQREAGSSSWCYTKGAPDMVAINYVIHRQNLSQTVGIKSMPLVNVFRGSNNIFHAQSSDPSGVLKPGARCDYDAQKNQLERLPSNWSLSQADAFIISRFAQRPRTQITCNSFPFAIFHNAAIADIVG